MKMNPETQLKIFLFLERLWLVAAVIGVACTVYFLVTGDNDSAVFFFGFFILSGLLFLLRKRQRVKHQAFLDQNGRASK
jgi:LPXTG-motif cell wall-anchored protein